MPQKFQAPGIVLQTHPLRESDVIATILTREHGKLNAVVRGARRSKKRFMGGIDVFDCGIFTLGSPRGKSDLYSVDAIEERQLWMTLRENLIRFSLASFALELAAAFAHDGDPQAGDLFNPLFHCLRGLNDAENEGHAPQIALFFHLLLLERSGFSPLADRLPLEPEVVTWLTEMIQQNKPLKAPSLDAAQKSSGFLINFTEQIVGKRLKTHGDLLSRGLLVEQEAAGSWR